MENIENICTNGELDIKLVYLYKVFQIVVINASTTMHNTQIM